ncbi:hypothetical protein [Paenibacillus agilis]|uniref:PARP catalytic domain-containing protein n=1 Tax=Paenibacillus agilis TaxID=3020863 RepID=A0A559ID07_9BACL|nr:hypothetical protein [Paenibacillus agilis]TVX85557.1 hypothetical protein FPZ44_24690 [Paenibacillus agilis]
MNWYHGTSKTNKEMILKTRFHTSLGIWGDGVYFSSSRDGASLFGGSIIQAHIPAAEMKHIDFKCWEVEHPNEETWPEMVKEFNCKAIAIHYPSGEIELCVFDPDVIRQINLSVTEGG